MSMLPGERVQKTFSGLIEALLEVGCREAGLTEPTGLQSQEILLLNVHLWSKGSAGPFNPAYLCVHRSCCHLAIIRTVQMMASFQLFIFLQQK